MGRILALDYGAKRVGVAVTDPMQLIASGLTTVATSELWDYLAKYLAAEKVDCLVVGYPVQMNGQGSESLRFINPFIQKFKQKYPDVKLELADERFTSKIAQQSMIASGMKKKDRQNKALVDGISAIIILQGYLEMKKNSFRV